MASHQMIQIDDSSLASVALEVSLQVVGVLILALVAVDDYWRDLLPHR